MSVWAVTTVRDEADIIASTVARMQDQVDTVVVADNGSTDGTREVLKGLDVWVLEDSDPAYYQSQKMTHLAQVAAEGGAEWVVPFDADEMWYGFDSRIADTLTALPDEALVAEATLYDHVATGLDDPGESDPVKRLGWRRRDPAPLRKVAVRVRPGLVIHQGNHSAIFEGVEHPLAVTDQLEVRHFPYRSIQQFVSKVRNGAAAYAATSLPADVGGHWRGYGRILDERGEEGLGEVFRTWFYRERPDEVLEVSGEHQPALIYDPAS